MISKLWEGVKLALEVLKVIATLGTVLVALRAKHNRKGDDQEADNVGKKTEG